MLPSSKSQGRSRFSDNTKGSAPFPKPYIHVPHLQPRGQVDDDHVIKLTSGSLPNPQPCSSKLNNTETDIVRHMKNLPTYLHPVQKPTTVQDRALNVGVLDWKRLQKWRDKEMLPKKCNAPAPSRQKKHGSVDLHVNVLPLSNHTRNSSEKVKNVNDSQYSVIGTTTAGKLPEKMKPSNTCLQLKNDEEKKVERNLKMTLQTEGLSQNSVTVPTSERQEESRYEDSIKPGPEPCADEPQDIVLLVPEVSRRSFFKNHHQVETMKGSGKSIEKSHSCRYSSQELQPGNHADKIPHSFQSPDNVLSTQSMRSCPVDSQNDARRSSRMRNSSVDYSTCAGTFEEMDYGSAEKAEAKSRPQSPNRRFSFNLGKIGRSFSFRESSTMAKDNSKCMDAKSGPISSGSISGIVDHNREKAHSSLGWSGSFRKILNPVLKSKAAQSAQASHHSNSVGPEPTSAVKNRDHASNFQALVQLSFKNQVPCFRFVAGNSCDILTASIKDVPTKTDNKFSYSFYSVTEVKKKPASWISHGSKDKHCCFDHTALCQMKISATCSSGMVMEYVLYGVHDKGGDPEVLPNREIGAIIVEEPAALAYGSKESEECKEREWDPCAPVVDATEAGETEDRNTITVLLPGGVHGLPKEGAPSSLMERWKSGGACDCGGWDMGCRVRVLIEQKEESDSSRSVHICSLIDRVDICRQEDGGKGRKQEAIFCLAPFKDGYYSVKYDSSRMSELEGFAICVAVLTSERLSDIVDVNLLVVKEEEKKKGNVILHSEAVKAKYYSSPPASPAGRI